MFRCQLLREIFCAGFPIHHSDVRINESQLLTSADKDDVFGLQVQVDDASAM